MNRQSHSDLLVKTLEANATTLLRENWLEFWSLYSPGQPLRIALVHTILPDDAAASYRVRTSVAVTARFSRCVEQNADCSSLAQHSRLREFRSVPIGSAAA